MYINYQLPPLGASEHRSRYESRYGPSHTSLKLGNLTVIELPLSVSAYASRLASERGPAGLYGELTTLKANITNTGSVASTESRAQKVVRADGQSLVRVPFPCACQASVNVRLWLSSRCLDV